jgi:hypothetical protein
MVNETDLSKIKTKNEKYVKDNLNDYEGYVITSILDWDAPKLRNCMRFKDKVNPNGCVNAQGTTFLHYAATKQDCNVGSSSIIGILLDSGANPFLKDSAGLTAYDYANLKNFTRNMEIIKNHMDMLTSREKEKIAKLERDSNK